MTYTPIAHHFVPKCYLRLFTDSQKKIWKKRNDNLKITQTHPSQICYEPNANKFRTLQILHLNNLNDAYHIEKNAFKSQENNFGRIIPLLTKYQETPKVIDKSKYRLFIETILTIKRRNPVFRNEIIEKFKESYKTEEGIKEFLKTLSNDTGIKHFTAEVENYIRGYLNVESQNPDRLYDMYLSAFVNKTEYNTISNITNDLLSLKQYILFAPIGSQFITSDNPGFLKSNGKISNIGGFGGDYEFYFPLSPTTCLYLNSKIIESDSVIQNTIYSILVNESDVKAINLNSKLLSKNFILSLSKRVLESF